MRRRFVWFLCLFLAAVCVGELATAKISSSPSKSEEPSQAASKFVVTADGNPISLLCKEDYIVGEFTPDKIVAKLGSAELTVGQLQALYFLEISSYQGEIQPDFSQSLAEQSCPLTKDELSWQHYFLYLALQHWEVWQGLDLVSQEPITVTEELFQPNSDDHAAYFPAGIPAEKVLYADRDCFTPNAVHQAYLDEIPSMTESAEHAAGTAAQDLSDMVSLMNRAYMLFTETTWEEAKAAASGADTVTIRHCLLSPENPDTADESAWENCRLDAESCLTKWQGQWLTAVNSESNFARLANTASVDAGTAADGGRLAGIRRGQLEDALDAWCFDPNREPGDTAVIRSSAGWHILYFCSRVTDMEAKAADDAMNSAVQSLLSRAAAYGNAEVDYSAITLATVVPMEDFGIPGLLYPDVGYQRFPEVPLYLQQDYGEIRYGNSVLSRGGCGVSSLAMVATYMTDSVYTPAMIAKQFPTYTGPVGTDGNIFLYAPADLGFYSAGQLHSWEDVLAWTQAGNPVVSLQMGGVFTTDGHFIVLSAGHDDGTVTVRDPSLKNYSRLDGFSTDRFTKADILSGATLYYAFQPKLVTLAGCSRCGNGKTTISNYVCTKCSAAITRREAFLALS